MATVSLATVVAACRRPPTASVMVGDEHRNVIIAEGRVSQRSFRAVDPSDRYPVHTVTFALEVGNVEPPEAASWLDEAVVFEKRATRQDADTFVGDRVRVLLDPHRGPRGNPWRGLVVEVVEPAARRPCPDGARSGTVPVVGSSTKSALVAARGMYVIEGRVVARGFDNVQKVGPDHPGYKPLQRIIMEIDARNASAPGIEEKITPPFRVTRNTRSSDLEIREGDVVRVAFERRPGILDNPAKLVWGEDITVIERPCSAPLGGPAPPLDSPSPHPWTPSP